jgi:hypothetical protein
MTGKLEFIGGKPAWRPRRRATGWKAKFRLICSYPAGTRINNVVNDDAECSEPGEVVGVQNRLLA